MKKSLKVLFICSYIILLIAAGFGVAWTLNKGKIPSFINNNSSSSNEQSIAQVQNLKYAEASENKVTGVYITDVSDIVSNVMPSIVAITSKTVISSGKYGPYYRNESYTSEGAGSGVIVAEDDNNIYILTNNHVVDGANELSVTFIDNESYDATIKGVSERKDVAIVAVSKSNISNDTLSQIKLALLGDSDDLKVGNGIVAIGNALGYGQSVTTGIISALNREVSTDEYTQEMIQIDAAINGGNSGGALLNSSGEVIGINTAKYSSSGSSASASIEGMGFAIPISSVKDIINKLISGQNDDDYITLGIEGAMTSNLSYNLPNGFYISGIAENSYASSSELEIGNIVTKIDGNTVTSVDTIRKVLNKKEKGDKVTLTVKYASKNVYEEKDITIVLN